MRKAIFVLEAINAMLGLIANIQNLELFGLTVSTWNIIVFSIFVAGFLALFWSDKDLERRIYNKVIAHVGKNLDIEEPQIGSLDTVTQQDRALIMSWAMQMIYEHGHMDVEGLLADRASGIPLNKLMLRNCSKCGKPRNQKSSDELDEE